MAFSGKAVYGTGVFKEMQEDVAPIVSIISPFETPLLDKIGDPPYEATNVVHEYIEGKLGPTRLYAVATVNNTSTTITFTPASSATQLMKGTIVENENTGEYFLVESATSAGTATITRGFGGTTAATIATSHTLTILYNAALEGADVDQDISVPRSRKFNIVQLFKKDIIVSGTVLAVTMAGGISDELNYQKVSRSREILRDLERAVIRGIMSTSTLGSSTEYRTMEGLWHGIKTNRLTYTTGSLTSSALNDIIKAAWENGAKDLDLIICGKGAKDEIDGLLDSSRRVITGQSGSRTLERIVDVFESTYGVFEIMLNRWMKPNSLIVTSTQRIKVVPLRGRTFRYEEVAKTGDSVKGMIVGEYTMEIWNEEGMARAEGS